MTGELTGRGVLAWLSAFFLAIMAVNAYFVYAAVSTFRGEDEQKPYLQGVEYGQTLARRAEQKRLGWTATIGAERLPSGDVRVNIALRDSKGAPAHDMALSGELRHPTDETRDHPLRLIELRTGQYVAEVAGVGPGAWDVVVTSSAKDTPFEASRRLWVR
ncbi:MAG TPA: FixH family protein [Rhizomicrobium sp.]|nr:FixH family protein [Rhizomicrobium sp.]